MTTPSPKLGLALPTQVDTFSTDDIRGNWEKIDGSPGPFICTSTTNPTTWTPTQAGRTILETNTGLEWIWNGTTFDRVGPTGLLKRNDGSWAIGERTTDFSTSSASFVKAVSVTNVVVPKGRRPIRVDVCWSKAVNGSASFAAGILRSNTNNSGPVQARWRMAQAVDANAGGGTFFSIERTGLPSGNYDFSFQINAPSGASTLAGDTTTPVSIFVTEL